MSRSWQNRPRAAARLASGQDAEADLANPPVHPPRHTGGGHAAPGNTIGTISAQATPGDAAVRIGVGIDTSRYGHHATFLRADLQPAAPDLKFIESGPGYQQLRQRLDTIAAQHGGHVHFHFRLDLAGRYADNLLAFLHRLFAAAADAGQRVQATISAGDPQRNKNYRVAIFGHKKSDPVESAACARYALTEKPTPTPTVTPDLRLLCQIASRLESQVRQGTRLINQLHNLVARTFPELDLLVTDLGVGWVLTLLERYPTAAKLARAHAGVLERIAHLPHERISTLLQQARDSVACLSGPAAEEMVRDLVAQLKDAYRRRKALEKLLVNAYRALPCNNHLDTIIGVGEVTAAVLTAKIVDAQRFAEPAKLVGYFGIFPVQASSGIDRDGKSRLPVRMIMSPRGNNLVRRYLWMAALSAVQHNPAVKPLYQRVRAKHPDQPAIALGHVMRKLLHLALAVWKTGKPFDPQHYPWHKAAHLHPEPAPEPPAEVSAPPQAHAKRGSENTQAAGHKNRLEPERSVVTAACGNGSVGRAPAAGNILSAQNAASASPCTPDTDLPKSPTPPSDPHASLWIDFAHLKSQLSFERILQHLDLLASLRGSRQRRGPCPLHGHGNPKSRTFSVHLDDNVFQCFHPQCGRKGDVIDFWAASKGLSLRDAARDLVMTFKLEPAP